MNCLVTGGCGFIGSHICETLIDEGHIVTSYDNLSSGRKENLAEGCELVFADTSDKKSLNAAMKGMDFVFHNSAFVTIRKSFGAEAEERIKKDNIGGTINVIEAAKNNNVGKILFASSMAVYGEPEYIPVDENHPLKPISPYGKSKIDGEKIIMDSGIDCAILRYFNTYGTRQTPNDYVGVITAFINQARQKNPLTVYGDGKQTRDFIFVKDVAKANILLMKHSGIYNVGTGVETSIKEIAYIIKDISDCKINYLEKPPGEINRISADITKLKKIGFNPDTDIRKHIKNLFLRESA